MTNRSVVVFLLGWPNNLERFLGSKSQFGGFFFDGVVNNILGEFFGFDRRQFGIPVGAEAVLGHQRTCALLADNHYCYATAKYHLMLSILQWNQTNTQIIAM